MSIQEMGFIHIGNSAMVSDPCYRPGTWCQGVLNNMKPGAYAVYGEILDCSTWGNRVSRIWIVHEDYTNVDINAILSYNYEDFEVGVDSGQAGIYDYEYYMNIYADESSAEEWYSRVCDVTYSDADGFKIGTLDEECVVSSSGFGDGSYTCQTGKNIDGEIVYVEIDYGVADEDSEEDEYDDDMYADDSYNDDDWN